MSLVEKLFGSFSDRELKKVNPIVKQVLALEPKYAALSDAELQAQTPAFKQQLADGKTLDDILPDAFAVCREAAWRVLGMKHFPVQITGGIALHRGDIAEMQTGEGKTLVATLPAYLNALTGEGGLRSLPWRRPRAVRHIRRRSDGPGIRGGRAALRMRKRHPCRYG